MTFLSALEPYEQTALDSALRLFHPRTRGFMFDDHFTNTTHWFVSRFSMEKCSITRVENLISEGEQKNARDTNRFSLRVHFVSKEKSCMKNWISSSEKTENEACKFSVYWVLNNNRARHENKLQVYFIVSIIYQTQYYKQRFLLRFIVFFFAFLFVFFSIKIVSNKESQLWWSFKQISKFIAPINNFLHDNLPILKN